MINVQIFGVRSSKGARAAERFFKERGIVVHSVDLDKKPMAPGEIRRFIEKFSLKGLVDEASTAYADAGLKYMSLSDSEWISRMEAVPTLLKLPLVRAGNHISIGRDEAAWKAMAATAKAQK